MGKIVLFNCIYGEKSSNIDYVWFNLDIAFSVSKVTILYLLNIVYNITFNYFFIFSYQALSLVVAGPLYFQLLDKQVEN